MQERNSTGTNVNYGQRIKTATIFQLNFFFSRSKDKGCDTRRKKVTFRSAGLAKPAGWIFARPAETRFMPKPTALQVSQSAREI
jgi:hypothetical protein